MAKKFVYAYGLHNVFPLYQNTNIFNTNSLLPGVASDADTNSTLYIVADDYDSHYGYIPGEKYIWTHGQIFNCNDGRQSITSSNSTIYLTGITDTPSASAASYRGVANSKVYATDGELYASGFHRASSSDSYVLLGGGGHKALSDFATSADYVKKAGDTMTGSLTTPSLTVTGASSFSQAINGSILGNAATASRWQNARTLTLTGAVTGSVSFDGSGNISLATTKNHNHAWSEITSGVPATATRWPSWSEVTNKPSSFPSWFGLGGTTLYSENTYTEIKGPLTIVTDGTDSKAFSIQGDTKFEQVNHWIDDNVYHIDYYDYDVSNSIYFRFINSDTKNPHDPSQASTTTVILNSQSQFYPSTSKTGSLGTSGNIWNSAYADQIYTAGITNLIVADRDDKKLWNTDGGYTELTWANIRNKPSTFPVAAHDHSRIITEGDNRNDATIPNNYANNIRFRGLKTKSAIGNPSTDTYSYLVGLRGWSDTSGGKAHEFAFNDSGINHRIGSTDAWGDWEKLVTSENYDDYVNTTTFPGLNSTGTVTSVTIKGGAGISVDSESAITSTGTRTITNTGVRSVTINSNYLKVNTNGTDANLTIPYALTVANGVYTVGDQTISGNKTFAGSTTLDDATIGNLVVTGGASFAQTINGNIATADKLSTARTISLTGDVTGSGTFDGSGNLSIATTKNHNHDRRYLRNYHDRNDLTTTESVTADDYFWNVGDSGGAPTTSTKPAGMDNAWGILHAHLHTGNFAMQLGFGGTLGHLYFRNAYNSSTFGAWNTIIDSTNYTEYVNTTNFPGLNKTGTVTSVATGTGLTGGTITTSGTISINSTYQTYISHGESAYNSLGNYVLKAGDTMTGALTVPSLSVTGASSFSQAINGSILGNAATASRLQNARTISLTGAITGSGTFDGSGNLSIATTKNHTHAFSEITGTVANNQLANSSITIAGQSVSLGGSLTTATLQTALGLGTAAYKNWTNSYQYDGEDLVTGKAIKAALDTLPTPMQFQGSVGSGGTKEWSGQNQLPAAAASNEGHTYKVITAHDTAPICKVGDTIISNGSSWVVIPSGDEPSGTVTSVGLSAPTGFSVSNSPVTSSGTLTLSYASGYSLPTTAKQSNWDTAYGWGNHAGLYLPIGGGTMTGDIKFNIASAAYNSNGLTWINGTSNLTHIGSDSAGGLGLYGTHNIYLRPSTGEGYTYGLVISKTDLTYNSNTVWHAGNDGSGSTLDADLLDGKHANEFSLSGHHHTLGLGNSTLNTENSYTEITGPFAVNTEASDTKAFSIQREASSEGAKHWVDDSCYHIDYYNDEVSNQIKIRFINTDTENPHDPSQASDTAVFLNSSKEFYQDSPSSGSIGTSGRYWNYGYLYSIYTNGINHRNSGSRSNTYVWNTNGGYTDLGGYSTTSHNHDDRYVNITGDTMTGALTTPSLTVTGASSFSQAINGSILGNATTASRLQNARTISLTGDITGSASFDGSNNISISTTANHNHDSRYVLKAGDTMTGLLTTTSSATHKGIKVGDTYINAIGGNLILQNNSTIRFGGDSWDYDVWAGLKYNHTNKIVYLGLADGSAFTANNYQSGGKLYLPGIDDIYTGNGTYKVWNEHNDGSGSTLDADLLDGTHKSDFMYRILADSTQSMAREIGNNLIIGFANGTTYTDMNGKGCDNRSVVLHLAGKNYSHHWNQIYINSGSLAFRSEDHTSWYDVIHSGNIGSQSVNYATSAGSAASASSVAWSNVTGRPASKTAWGQTYIDSSGDFQNVDGVLNITGESNFAEGIRLHHLGGLSSIWFGAVNNYGYDAGMWGITVDSNGMRFRGPASTSGTSASDYMNILHGGNVGIGTTSPSTKLHVIGAATISTSISAGTSITAGTSVTATTTVTAGTSVRASGGDIYVGSASGSQCHQVYDSTNKVLKFLFD